MIELLEKAKEKVSGIKKEEVNCILNNLMDIYESIASKPDFVTREKIEGLKIKSFKLSGDEWMIEKFIGFDFNSFIYDVFIYQYLDNRKTFTDMFRMECDKFQRCRSVFTNLRENYSFDIIDSGIYFSENDNEYKLEAVFIMRFVSGGMLTMNVNALLEVEKVLVTD